MNDYNPYTLPLLAGNICGALVGIPLALHYHTNVLHVLAANIVASVLVVVFIYFMDDAG